MTPKGRENNQQQTENLLGLFNQFGVDSSRIDLFDRMRDKAEHLNLYNSIDICLDTHPYSGTTTTFESLVMGVPVFTLVGPLHLSRVTGAILKQLGLTKFIVQSPKNYISQLKKITQDKQNLDRNYRYRVLESSLCDGSTFTNKLEHGLKKIL